MILEGRVSVGGEKVASPGATVLEGEEVAVDGKPVTAARACYIAMNKPRGVISAARDARERTVIDLLPERYRGLGLFPAGRLDMDSEGLIILTNDGMFSNAIAHPSNGVRKTYVALLRDVLTERARAMWEGGVVIAGRSARPLELSPGGGGGRIWRVVLGEGFKREIRLMAEAVGNKVLRLKRVGIGKLFLKNLPSGAFCEYNCDDLYDMIANGGDA
jgi:23S rRNA pseudouridine2605 synthase